MPAEADGLDTHEMSAWHSRVTQTGRGEGPLPELSDERLLLVRREPAGDQNDAWRDLESFARTSIQRERALLVARRLVGRQDGRHTSSETGAHPRSPARGRTAHSCRVHDEKTTAEAWM